MQEVGALVVELGTVIAGPWRVETDDPHATNILDPAEVIGIEPAGFGQRSTSRRSRVVVAGQRQDGHIDRSEGLGERRKRRRGVRCR